MNEKEKSIYGLIGYPLDHSLSPVMHNTAFDELGVNAVYNLFPLKEDELENFFIQLKKETSFIFGLNVTIPYKEKVIPYLDSLSPYAQKVHAINTIVIKERRSLQGFNTDGPGFLTHLTEIGFSTKNKRVAILGAGGAARAVISIFCLIPERPASIRIYDIDKSKADCLLNDLSRRIDVSIMEVTKSIDDLNIEIADLLINATPIGMKKNDGLQVEEELLQPNLFVYDLIYNPAETKLLKAAKKKGARVSNGLGMLFYQGVLAFQHWADCELKDTIKEKMRENLRKALNV